MAFLHSPLEKLSLLQQSMPSKDKTGVAGVINKNYFQHFPKKPKDLFRNAPSDVIAIVLVPGGDDKVKTNSPSLLLVCEKGQFIALSSRDWSTVEWSYKVSNLSSLLHAVYDEVKDEIYFVNYETEAIYRLNFSNMKLLNSKISKDAVVEPEILVDKMKAEGRKFMGLAIDSSNRLLYACDYYGKIHRDVSIWLLPSTESNAQLIGSIKTGYKPSCCSFHISDEPAEYFYLAVTDLYGHRVDLLAADRQRFFDKLLIRRSTSDCSEDAVVAEFDVGSTSTSSTASATLKRVDFITHEDPSAITSKSLTSSVYWPREVAFDANGNLFVAHNGSGMERIQVLAFVRDDNEKAKVAGKTAAISDLSESRPMTMAVAWVSKEVGPSVWILTTTSASKPALHKGATKGHHQEPCLLTHGSSGKKSIAIFQHCQ